MYSLTSHEMAIALLHMYELLLMQTWVSLSSLTNSPPVSGLVVHDILHVAQRRCRKAGLRLTKLFCVGRCLDFESIVLLQAAKQERRRQFNAAERERKAKNKSAAVMAHEQRELEVRRKQLVWTMDHTSGCVQQANGLPCTACYLKHQKSPCQSCVSQVPCVPYINQCCHVRMNLR